MPALIISHDEGRTSTRHELAGPAARVGTDPDSHVVVRGDARDGALFTIWRHRWLWRLTTVDARDVIVNRREIRDMQVLDGDVIEWPGGTARFEDGQAAKVPEQWPPPRVRYRPAQIRVVERGVPVGGRLLEEGRLTIFTCSFVHADNRFMINDMQVAPDHFAIEGDGRSGWRLVCFSRRGLTVDGAETFEAALSGGEVIRIGDTDLLFELTGPGGGVGDDGEAAARRV